LAGQSKLALVLGATVVGLALVYLTTGEALVEDAEGVATGIGFESEAVSSVRVTTPEFFVEVQQEEESWSLVDPIKDRGNPFMINQLLDSLQASSRGVALVGVSGEELGLAPEPRATILVTTRDGEQLSVQVGDKAPVGWHTYVKTGEEGYFAVEGGLATVIKHPVDDYRRRELFDFDLAQVTRVVMRSAPGVLDASADEERVWWLDGFSRVDEDSLENLLVALYRLNFVTFHHVDLPVIEEPEFEIEVYMGDAVQRVAVGSSTQMGRLALDYEGRAGFMDPKASAFLAMGPTDLGLRKVRTDTLGRLTSVTISGPNGQWTAQQAGDGWASQGRDENTRVKKCLDALAATTLVYRLVPPSAPDSPLFTVELSGDNGEIALGFSVLDAEHAVMVDQAGGSPIRVEEPAFRELLKGCVEAFE
jgi:hypothetical protein